MNASNTVSASFSNVQFISRMSYSVVPVSLVLWYTFNDWTTGQTTVNNKGSYGATNNGTLMNGATVSTQTRGSKTSPCLYLNGQSQYMQIPPFLFGGGSFTVCFGIILFTQIIMPVCLILITRVLLMQWLCTCGHLLIFIPTIVMQEVLLTQVFHRLDLRTLCGHMSLWNVHLVHRRIVHINYMQMGSIHKLSQVQRLLTWHAHWIILEKQVSRIHIPKCI